MLRFSALGLAFAVIAAAPAAAQDAPQSTQAYVGVSGGYHDLGNNPFGSNGGAIGGAVAGVDIGLSPDPVGPVIGVEGNFHLGTGAIDSEYGAAARIGYKFPSGGLAYVRAGYQWINFDIGNVVDIDGIDDDATGIDDTDGDYLVGVGGEFPLGSTGRTRLRVGVDTVAFDTWRPNAAFILNF